MKTQQIYFWSGNFGREYTDRNTMNHEAWNQQYVEKYGISRLDINHELLWDLPKNLRILEVGCNTGQQIEALRQFGFENITGIELQFMQQNGLEIVRITFLSYKGPALRFLLRQEALNLSSLVEYLYISLQTIYQLLWGNVQVYIKVHMGIRILC